MRIGKFGLGLALVVVLSGLAASPARATQIVAGTTNLHTRAIQDITLLANTAFNDTDTDIVLTDLFGDGVLTLNRDEQVGNTINIGSFSGGMYVGSYAGLGDYVFGNVAPLTGADFSGVITNVVQDPNDPGFATGQASSFQSGDFSFGGASFGFQFLSGPAAGLTLFTDPAVAFSFSATFDGLPPSVGTVLQNSGPDVLEVLFNGQVVATSSNRRIVVTAAPVPEPSTIAMLASGAIGLVGYRLRRRRAAKA